MTNSENYKSTQTDVGVENGRETNGVNTTNH